MRPPLVQLGSLPPGCALSVEGEEAPGGGWILTLQPRGPDGEEGPFSTILLGAEEIAELRWIDLWGEQTPPGIAPPYHALMRRAMELRWVILLAVLWSLSFLEMPASAAALVVGLLTMTALLVFRESWREWREVREIRRSQR